MRSDDFYLPGAEDLMPLEVPLLKVSRPIAACQRCRAAKIKCDGKLPACTACERSGRAKQCSSGNSQFAPGKERSYVSTLEAKVEKLERRIAEARRRRQSSISMLDFGSPITPLSRSSTMDSLGRPKDRRAKFRKELGTVDELVSDFGFLTVNATARDYQYGFTNAISYARLIIAAASKEPLPSGMKKELPLRSDALPLIKIYVENLLTLHPVLEEGEIYRALDAMTGHDRNNATAMDAWTTRLILAISSAMQSRQRGDSMYTDAIGHVCAALEVADQVLHPGSIWSIQAMLLLIQFSMLDPAHLDSWTLVGAASRAMVDLGLHQDPSKSAKTPRQKLELRRRIYQCVYCLDRCTSIVQTRAFSFSDDSANVGLPFSTKSKSPVTAATENVWSKSNEISLAFIKWRQIQSSWYTQLFQSSRVPWSDPYQHIWKIYYEMAHWLKTLPQITPQPIRDYLELDLLYSYVYILSPSSKCPSPNEHAQRLIIENSSAYANMVKRLQTESAEKLSPFTFYDALRVYTVARHFLDTLSANIDILLQPHMDSGVSTFTNVKPELDTQMDPLAPAPTQAPPPLASPDIIDHQSNPTSRAIDTINTFLAILSVFGHRFGLVSEVSWRDKLAQEAQPLLTQLQNRLQAQLRGSTDSYFWSGSSQTGPVTPGLDASSPPHRVSASFYPSPATTQYSPGYVPTEIDTKPWSMNASSIATMSGLVGSAHDFGNDNVMNEFGISNMTAWETLPGGSMNPRFS
ncbi:hypothetical protein BT63DRAFT_422694 [Microthyrium microscopicum]|uniref:Zn(2)-C6 fungal-type domain-containing protein n=1 Tax=Microthyrium microscopicum TaxID=703497 RepID=A0A6A6UKY5_9PEZI|nr:hypothetical protein BT63DRAFT_422694 [Microthyrium microscopicum]